MRKYKLIIGIITAVIVFTAGCSFAVARHQQQVRKEKAYNTDQTRKKQLADWQQKVQAWQQSEQTKRQVAMASNQSDLQNQGVKELPNTGPGNLVTIFVLTSVLGTTSYYLRAKQ